MRLPYGEAKVQFVANIDEIKGLIEKGYGLYQIYSILYNEGKITIKYAYFHRLVKNHGMKALELDPLITSKNKSKSNFEHSIIPYHEKVNTPQLSGEQDDSFGIIKKSNDEVF